MLKKIKKYLVLFIMFLLVFNNSIVSAGSLRNRFKKPPKDNTEVVANNEFFSKGPKNFKAYNLTNGVDADGIINFSWDTLYINNQRAKKYRILINLLPVTDMPIILSQNVYSILDPYDYDDEFNFKKEDPVYMANTDNGKKHKVAVNILSLLGNNLETALSFMNQKVKNFNTYKYNLARKNIIELFNGEKVTLYFKVIGSNAIDGFAMDEETKQPIEVPILDKDGRPEKKSDGSDRMEKVPAYSFSETYASEELSVSVKLSSKPKKIKLIPLERKKDLGNNQIYFDVKKKISESESVMVRVDPEDVTKFDDITKMDTERLLDEDIIIDVYDDGDGIIDFKWEVEEDGSIPQYTLYSIQISKWPNFWYAVDLLKMSERFFDPRENVYEIYAEDFINVDAKQDSLLKDSFNETSSKLTKPFFSRNLAIQDYKANIDGTKDFGKPLYFNNDPYGSIDKVNFNSDGNFYTDNCVYYFRIRALGTENKVCNDHGDNRTGDWSDIIAVRLKKGSRLPMVNLRMSPPQEIDDERDVDEKLIPKAKIPMNWKVEIENGTLQDPKKYNAHKYIYEIAVAKDPNFMIKNSSDTGLVNYDYDLISSHANYFKIKEIQGCDVIETEGFGNDFALPDSMGIGDAGDPHFIKNMINKFNKKADAGKYYCWIRTLQETGDAIPSFWSEPVSVDIPEVNTLNSPIVSSPGKEEGVVDLNWNFENEGDAAKDGVYYDKVSYYMLMVYYNQQESPVNIIDDNDYLKDIDSNANGINDWQETTKSGGKAYGVYMIKKEDILTDKPGVLYQANLNEVYNLKINCDGSHSFIQERKIAKKGNYSFYLIGYDENEGAVSKPLNIQIQQDIEIPEMPVIIDPVIANAGNYNQTVSHLVPLNWKFSESIETQNDKYGIKQEKYNYDFYQVLVYRSDLNSSSMDSPLDSDGKLKIEDTDNNDINDYEEVMYSNNKGRAFAVYNILPEYLGHGTLENPYSMINLTEREYVTVDINGKKEYKVVSMDLPKGDYRFYIRASRAGIFGEFSNVSGRYKVTNDIKRPAKPNLLDPNSASEQNVAQGQIDFWLSRAHVPLSWNFTDSAININSYDDYEIVVSKENTLNDFGGGAYLSPKSVYIRNYITQDQIDPQKLPYYLKNLAITSYNKVLKDGKTIYEPIYNDVEEGSYYLFIRAIDNEIKGSWSDAVSVEINNPRLEPLVLSVGSDQLSKPFANLQWESANYNGVYEIQMSSDTFFDDIISKDFVEISTNSNIKLDYLYKEIGKYSYSKIISMIGRDDNDDPIYVNDDINGLPNGDYYFRVREIVQLSLEDGEGNPTDGRGLMGWSNTASVNYEKGELDKIVLVKPASQPSVDKNGIIGLNWQFEGETKASSKYLKYPVYEVQISKGKNSFAEPITAIDYIASQYFYDEEDNTLRPFIYIRDIISIPLKDKDGNIISFSNNTNYYFRVRALTSNGYPTLYTDWSNVISIKINKASVSKPSLSSDPAPTGNILNIGNYLKKLTINGESYANINFFDIIINAQNMSAVRSYELLEIELDANGKEVNEVFMSLERIDNKEIKIARSPDYKMLETPQQLKYSTSYKYRVRAWNKVLDGDTRWDTADGSDDAAFSDWSAEFRVNIGKKGSAGWR